MLKVHLIRLLFSIFLREVNQSPMLPCEQRQSTFGYDFKLHPENAQNYFEFDSLQMNPYLPQVSTSSESYVRYDLAIRQALATVMALTPPFEHHCLILISDGQAVNSSRPVWHDLFDYVRNWLR